MILFHMYLNFFFFLVHANFGYGMYPDDEDEFSSTVTFQGFFKG